MTELKPCPFCGGKIEKVNAPMMNTVMFAFMEQSMNQKQQKHGTGEQNDRQHKSSYALHTRKIRTNRSNSGLETEL